MIKAINVPQLRNNEFLQFISDVLKRCERFDLVALNLNEGVTELKTIIARLERVYNKDTGSELSDKMAAADALRDNDLIGIRDVCLGYSRSRNIQEAEAAKRILESIDHYGKALYRLNYQAQTAVVDALISDWENKPELIHALDVLDLTSWAQSLKEENINFSNLYQQRLDDKLDTAGASFSDLRSSVIAAYRTLCNTISAYSVVSKDEQYIQLADAVNLIVADYQAIIDRRQAGKADDKAL